MKPDGRQASKRGFARKKDAADYLATVDVGIGGGTYIDPRNGRTPLGELGATWIQDQRAVLKPSTYHSVESSWRIHVEPRWSKKHIEDIQHSDVRRWVAELATVYSATTVIRAHGVLANILEIAVRDKLIPTNNARNVPLPRKGHEARVYLTHAQVDALAEQARYPDLVLTLAYTGLRWGEASALRVRNIDTAKRRLRVEQNAVTVNGKIRVGTPKTHVSRTVPYPAFLDEYFQHTKATRSPDALVFGDGVEHLRLPNSKDGWFAAAVRRCQRADPTFPRLTPHDLWHTVASLAVSAGANVKAVQRMLGHASAVMTLDTYADLFDDDLDGVSTALDVARSTSRSRDDGNSGEH
ncbi:MAG TPA: tyrosine-type recombinase/integrase [Microbacterium sp.]|uniref:tyrosine-type recombinase/integrase n=1 Tax=Microbacterium sp. TaxID=51671 RepID=UPI002B49CBB0|nr:tyrosine-type recombinase/integrase [Microbacterium sp.]HKT55232.1 tyrosine-type recombinase/integrase [Microbacterium sp.]